MYIIIIHLIVFNFSMVLPLTNIDIKDIRNGLALRLIMKHTHNPSTTSGIFSGTWSTKTSLKYMKDMFVYIEATYNTNNIC